MRKLCLAATVFAVTLTGTAAPAFASWSNVLRLSADGGTDTARPQVVTDDAGNAIASWFQVDATTGGLNAVAYATRTTDGTWTPKGFLSAPGENIVGGNAWPVVLAEAPTGQAVIGWALGSNHALKASVRTSATGTFSAPAAITGGGVTCANNVNLTDDDAAGPTAALGAGGAGWIGWNAGCGRTSLGFRAYVRSIQSGIFGVPTDVGQIHDDGGSVVGPALGVDRATGAGQVAFIASGGTTLPIVSRPLSFTTGAGVPANVTTGTGGRQVVAITGPSVEPIAAYMLQGDGVYVKDGDATAVRVSPLGQNPAGAYPQLAGAKDGTLVVAWRDVDGNVWAAVRHAGAWGAAQQLSNEGADTLHVVIADNDVAYVTWQREVSQFEGIEASVMDPGDPTRSPGAPWSFQPTAEVVVDPADAQLPTILNAEVTYSALTVRPDGVATIALTWRNSFPGGTTTHAVGVIESSKPVGIGGTTTTPPADDSTTPPPADTTVTPSVPVTPLTPVARDTRAPALTVFNASRKIFATGSKLDKKVAGGDAKTVVDNGLPKAGLQVGTTFKWTQDEAGKAKLTIVYEGCDNNLTGKTVNGYKTCSHKAKDGGTVYTKTVSAGRGANTLKYLGTATKGKYLLSGASYTAELNAIDAAGNVSKAKTIRFRVDSPKG
jgi:hypothetical protein